jgi:hypothetical protein
MYMMIKMPPRKQTKAAVAALGRTTALATLTIVLVGAVLAN